MLTCLLATVGAAQSPLLPAPPAPATGAPAARADLDELIRTLEDPAARDALVARLKSLTAAAPPAAELGTFASLAAGLNAAAERRLATAGDVFAGVVGSVRQVPILARWVRLQLAEPISRGVWATVALETGTAVLAGLLASLAARVPLRRWRERVAALPPEAGRGARTRASSAHLAVDLSALAVFLAVTSAVLAWTDTTPLAARVAADVLLAIGIVRGLTALSRALLAPADPRRRLPPLADDAARDSQHWLTTVLGLGVYGYFALQAGARLGLPPTVQGFLNDLLFLAVTLLVIVQIYRLRGAVAALIRRWGAGSSSAVARYLPWEALAAGGGHLLAAWVALVYLIWALGIPNGAVLLTRGFVVSLVALLALRVLHVWLDRTLLARRDPAVEEEAEPEPASTTRAAVVTALRAGAMLVALGCVLAAWGLDVAGGLRSDIGRSLLASLGRIGAVAIVALAAAKAVQVFSTRYIAAVDDAGQPLHSNRTRTLVSMARNVALTVLGAVSVVEVLSEVGVNTNALLAGAGVVGLAVGFGSQRLVQDLITGLFILLGDTVRVGDVVELGGKGGVVEAISMRTITLRDWNGNVYTIPHSSIDVVTNMTKEFSFAVFDVAVAYGEDPDRVMAVLRELDTQLRREWPYRRLMLEPLEIAGVDQFRESSILVKARSKVRAGEQWKVAREFNRRLKHRFDELGIAVPYPQHTIRIEGGRGGDAAAAPAEEPRRRDLLAMGES